MTVVMNCQFYPRNTFLMDSLHSSVSKFYARRPLPFFRCSSLHYAVGRDWINPQKRYNHLRRNNNNLSKIARKTSVSLPRDAKSNLAHSAWLDNWNEARATRPQVAVSYRNRGDVSSSDAEESTSTSTGGSTMQRIVEKLKKFGYVDDVSEQEGNATESGSIEDIFHVEEGLLPNTRGGFSKRDPFGDKTVVNDGEIKFPWEKKNVDAGPKITLDGRRNRSMAEMTLPESELRRLKILARKVNRMKVGGSGVTQKVLDAIHQRWKSSEVVRLKIEGAPALNMKRMHEILERKTGGLVIWRSGTCVCIYRGVAYKELALKLKKQISGKNDKVVDDPPQGTVPLDSKVAHQTESSSADSDNKEPQKSSEIEYEVEIEQLLNGLGPRYTDWPRDGPLPVDADLLPGFIGGYQPPFRLLPYGVKSVVQIKEATALRRLARTLPPHFALGRSRQLHGLASAMIKLWERSSIAKIALKRGVQLTTSERMAEDLKKLTGGFLLSRNKDFLVFYRGKDFLSPDVAETLLEKERLAKSLQDEEEQARSKALTSVTTPFVEEIEEYTIAGTLKETMDANSKWGKLIDEAHEKRVMREAEVLRHANLVRKLETKLAFAEKKVKKAERTLSKVEASLYPADHVQEQENLTDEERFMFRKLGLRMKAYLLLGRRGVFDGTVENMHLHWKYRELVKILVKAPNIEEVKDIALSLEAESGGVLVSVDKLSNEYAIIVFRGREYKRPPHLRPKNLLTKRKALSRSIELQRRQALFGHISNVRARANQLRSEIDQMTAVKERGDEALYNKLDSAYLTEDEEDTQDDEEEDDSDFPEVNAPGEYEDRAIDGDVDFDMETNFPYDFEEESETEFAE